MSSSNIKLKRSAVPGKIPSVGQIDLGEFAVNTFDGKLYTKKSVNGTESIVTFFGAIATDSSVILDSFTGDGITTEFTLSRIPKTDQHSFITINGVSQQVDAYSITNNILTFVDAPADQDAIEVRTIDVITASVAIRDYATFIYTADADDTFTGPDDNGKTLEYDPTRLEVYVNGARLVDGLDFTATNGSSVVLAQTVTGTVEIVSLSRASFLENPITGTNTDFATTSGGQVVDSFNATEFRTAKYLVQMSAGGNFHATEILLIHDDINTYITEYATILTDGSLGEFTSDLFGGNVRLLVTPNQTDTNVKVQRLSIRV
jgi:hypothetical protein